MRTLMRISAFTLLILISAFSSQSLSTTLAYMSPIELTGDPLGQTFLLGTTWWDLQHVCTIGRMISMTPGRGLHFCWMEGLGESATERHVYYNYFANGVLMWPDVGVQLDQGRGGYPTVSHFNEGEAVIAFHHGDESFSALAYDFIEGMGSFQHTSIDNPGWGELLWPKMAICSQGNIHLVAFEHTGSEWCRIAYARSGDGGPSFGSWTVIDTILTISPDIAASPVSNKVGIAYTKNISDNIDWYTWPVDYHYYNNDVILVESEDGVTWDFSHRQNITHIIDPDTSRYPDTTWARGDTLRAYCDLSLFYDQNDYAHIAFTTRGLWHKIWAGPVHIDSIEIISRDASMIWHWSEEHDTLTRIADGWYDVGDPDPHFNERRGAGNSRSTVDRPCLAQDPATGYLYCVYVRCTQGDTSGGEGDSHGWANGEIYCSVSTDGGLNWSEGTNLTNTPTPNAWAGDCMDEDYSSMAAVVNDTLHIMYVEDKDAGGAVMDAPQEGTWTENPVKYLRVPASLVPPGPPFVDNFDFHVAPGGTGVQEPYLVDGAVPQAFALHQNYPNPFNPETTIRFDLPQAGPVSLNIYNVTGQLVRELTDGQRQAGTYEIRWNGRNEQGHLVPSGIYFCHMKAGKFTETRKMALIK